MPNIPKWRSVLAASRHRPLEDLRCLPQSSPAFESWDSVPTMLLPALSCTLQAKISKGHVHLPRLARLRLLVDRRVLLSVVCLVPSTSAGAYRCTVPIRSFDQLLFLRVKLWRALAWPSGFLDMLQTIRAKIRDHKTPRCLPTAYLTLSPVQTLMRSTVKSSQQCQHVGVSPSLAAPGLDSDCPRSVQLQ